MQTQLDKALVLIRRVILAIATCPKEIKTSVEEFSGTVEMTITGNPADTKRLVGKRAETLKTLSMLFRLLARGCGKNVGFAHLVPNENPEPRFAGFITDASWDRDPVEALLRDLAEAVFECPVTIKTEEASGHSAKMYAVVQADLEDSKVLGLFDKLVNVLFVPIGTKVGMRVYAHAIDWNQFRQATMQASDR